MSQDLRIWREWLVVTALLAGTMIAAAYLEWFWRTDHAIYDAVLPVWHREAPHDLVIVTIDDESLAQIGRWPWRRAVHATLINRLSTDGAKAIGIDIMFTEPDENDPASDASLVEAMRRNGKIVLPVTSVSVDRTRTADQLPLPDFAGSAAALGSAHVEFDADGLARRVKLWTSGATSAYPHFALAMLGVSGGWQSGGGKAAPHGPTAAAVSGSHEPLLLPYAAPPGHFERVSYADVLTGAVPPGYFRDKIVLVGATGAGLGDTYATPTSRHNRIMNGVEIHAHAIDALRRSIFVAPVPNAVAGALAGLTVVALLLGLRRASPRTGLLLTGAVCVASLAFAVLLLRFGLYWYPPMAALFGCLTAYPLWSWRRLEATQRFLDVELERLQQEPPLLGSPAPAAGRGADRLQQRIEALRAATDARRKTRRFISDAVESLPVGVLVTDAAQQVVLANRNAHQLLGVEQGSALGQPLADVLHALHLAPNSGFETLLATLNHGAARQQAETADEAGRVLLLGVAGSCADDDTPSGYIVSLVDVSELRRAQLVRDETMRFISHDLRAPLASIISMIDVMKEPDPVSAGLFSLDQVQGLARRALDLAEDFMRLARAEALDVKKLRPVDLTVMARQAVEEITPLARSRHVAFDTALEPAAGSAFAAGDADLLRRAVINLLNNAVRYSPEHSKVAVSLHGEGGRWILTVADTGPGIPPEQLPQLFSRYVRLNSERDSEGVGLGLVIVKTVVTKHGGKVAVDSAPGRGARFTVELPRLAQSAPASAAVV